MIKKILGALPFCFLATEGCSDLSGIDFKIKQILQTHANKAEEIWNIYVKQYKEQGTLPAEIRLFDPAQGRSNCEEQATILKDLLLQKKYFNELDSETQQYITLRFLFVPTRFIDPFGMMVSKSKDSKILQDLDPEVVQALRQKISSHNDKQMMKLAKDFLSEEIITDTAFTHTPVGKVGLT